VKTWKPNTYSKFTHDEQFTVMTLWSIARSPLIMGGNMPDNDEFTLALLTNDEVLAVNQHSDHNKQLFNTNNQVAWVADVPESHDKYLALFNTLPAPVGGGRRGRGGPPGGGPAAGAPPVQSTAPAETQAPPVDPSATEPKSITVALSDIGLSGSVKVRDLWNHKDLDVVKDNFTQVINSHGAGLYRLSPAK
jgi:alpha-galactosidase